VYLINLASEKVMRYAQKRSASAQKTSVIFEFLLWNVASAREWDSTAEMVCWQCEFSQLRILEETLGTVETKTTKNI